MNIVFLSNVYNHHQKSISQKLFELTGGNFIFISTAQMTEEGGKYGDKEHDEFVYSYNCENSSGNGMQIIIDSADVVIVGSGLDHLISSRIKGRKLVFRYTERPLKNGFQIWKYLPRLYLWHKRNPKRGLIYVLCASSYTASDYEKFGLFKNRVYKWGYFPRCKRYSNFSDIMSKKEKTEILWCGRFLKWKHPDDVLRVAKKLKVAGYDFTIKFIGSGEMEGELKEYAIRNDLSDKVVFLGALNTEQVREHMECAGIYLFTSDRREGWGAVLNEAMNSGCAVVSSIDAGATSYLVKHNENGMIFNSNDINSLYHYVKYLLDNPNEQNRIGKAAYKTIVNEWNADVAAERLIAISTRILEGEDYPNLYTDGPCAYSPRKKTIASIFKEKNEVHN